MAGIGETSRDTIRVQLNYPVGVVDRPIVYTLVTEFGLIPDIRRANIDAATGGYLFLELTGERVDLERAISWLASSGITVDAIGVDGAQEWAV